LNLPVQLIRKEIQTEGKRTHNKRICAILGQQIDEVPTAQMPERWPQL
jgi:hypothetical protein